MDGENPSIETSITITDIAIEIKANINSRKVPWITGESVSYTHLDVYKRQL